MTDEEIKSLLRDLAEKADVEGRSETVRIRMDRKPQASAGTDAEPQEDPQPEDDGRPAGERGRKKSPGRRKSLAGGFLEGLRRRREEKYLDEPDTEEPELEEDEEEDGERRFTRPDERRRPGRRKSVRDEEPEEYEQPGGDEEPEEPEESGDPDEAEGPEKDDSKPGARDLLAAIAGFFAGIGSAAAGGISATRERAQERKAERAKRKAEKEAEAEAEELAEGEEASAVPEEEAPEEPSILPKTPEEPKVLPKTPEEAADSPEEPEAPADSPETPDTPADLPEDDFLDDDDDDFSVPAGKRGSSVPDDDHPLRGNKSRKTPVEPADFESDAHLFMDEEAALEPTLPPVSLRQRAAEFYAMLKGKGIAARELLMILAGIVLLGLIAAVILSAMGSRRKMENVTADEGLTVTVEKEPAAWCSHADVTLGIRTGSPIQSITVNEETCTFEGTRKTQVTVDARSEILDVMVVTEDKVLGAKVELPMIDAEDPVISISSQNGMASLDAVDSRSGLQAVYYGEVWGLSDVPVYTQYTGPFQIEADTVYSFYAQDVAGNMTKPVVTDMTEASALVLDQTAISLFPGETAQLQFHPEPALGYLNDLEIRNSDESVAVLDAGGTITAVANGTTMVEISARGLPAVTCAVTVHSEAEVTISAIGDLTLGDDENFYADTAFSAYQSMYGNSYFFENVRDILGSDDITFGNMEGTLTTQGSREPKEYAFRGDPSYTGILQDGSVEVVTLANNHSRDYGEVSLTDTQKYLDEAGIAWCMGEHIAYKDVEGIRAALIGIYVLDEGIAKTSEVQETIKTARAAGADLVIVAFHWGSELADSPDETQVSLAHTAIDTGADLVVGHHPHVLQGIEVYKNKYIAYSLGNFCFGGNSNPTDKDTMIFQQTFRVGIGGLVTSDGINIIPCSISSTDETNDYRPTPATGSEESRIRDRVRTLSSALGTML